MTKHTQGRVRVDPRASTRVVAGEDDTIATTGLQSNLGDQWEANAAFIVLAWNSHAPMLTALRKAREYVAAIDGTMGFTAPDKRVTAPDLKMIDDAIAAAEGQ